MKTWAPWTTREIARLRRLYPVMRAAELQREFHPRTMAAIKSRAILLKIGKNPEGSRCRDWAAIASQHKPSIVLVNR